MNTFKPYILGIALAVSGILVGYFLSPTQSIKRELREVKETHAKEMETLREDIVQQGQSQGIYEEIASRTIDNLTVTNTELRASMKRRRFKLVKPDGTIIEKEWEESETQKSTQIVTQIREEFNTKIKSVETKWKSVHIRRIKKIKKEYEEKLSKVQVETIEINKKNLRPEIGVTSSIDVYLHASYPLWGPVFISGGVSYDPFIDQELGEFRLGLGLEL